MDDYFLAVRNLWGGGGGGGEFRFKEIWPERSPPGRGCMTSYQLGIWLESNIRSLFSS